MNQPNLFDVALIVGGELERLGVPYLIGGSVASTLHGEPRLTNDVDFAAVMRDAHVLPFVRALQGPFYAVESEIRSAIRRRSIFNVIHIRSAGKMDVHVLEPDRFQKSQLERAIRVPLREGDEQRMPVATAEDIVLQKLIWHRKGDGASERQIRDVLGVLKQQRTRLDLVYMRSWARELDLTQMLERVLRDAGIESA